MCMGVDFTKITALPHVEEIREVVGIWEISIDQCPVVFKVKVIRTGVTQAEYSGIANYAIQNPGQGTTYFSYANCQSIQKALEDSIIGFLRFYKIDQLKDTVFEPVKDW